MVDEVGCTVDHAPCTARGTEPSFATTERHDVLVSTTPGSNDTTITVALAQT